MENKDFILFNKAKKISNTKKYYDALKIYKKLFLKYPDDLYVKLEYAKHLIQLNQDIKLGRELLESLLNTKINNYAIFELGKLEFKVGEYNLAERYFNKLLNTSSRYYALIELAKIKRKFKDYDMAKKYLLEIINSNDKNKLYAILEMSKLEKEFGNYDISQKYLNLLLNTEYKEYALLERARLYKEIGEYEQAKELYESLIDSKYRDMALYELGTLYYELKNYSLAEFYYTEILEHKGLNKNYALVGLGKIEKEKNNYDKSEEYFLKVIKSGSENKNFAYYELIILYIKEERYLDAYKLFDEMIECNKYSKEKIAYSQIQNIIFYLKFKLNLLTKEEKENTSFYFKKQVVNYDEFEAIDHISKHLEETDNKILHSLFNQNIDILNLYYVCSNLITNINPSLSTFVDIYTISFDNPIGTIMNEVTNTVQVVTIINTKNIIAIYPISKKQIKGRDSLCR